MQVLSVYSDHVIGLTERLITPFEAHLLPELYKYGLVRTFFVFCHSVNYTGPHIYQTNLVDRPTSEVFQNLLKTKPCV
jgi:hypothetical protein